MLESEGRIRDAIQQAAARECVKVKEHIGEQITVQIFDKELARAKRALNNKNLDEMLRLAPGKELLTTLMWITGCKSHSEVARGAAKHLNPESYQHLKKLHCSLLENFSKQNLEGLPANED